MDSRTLAQLADIGRTLVTQSGAPNLEDIQVQRAEEDVTRKEVLDSLRERVTAAIVLLLGSLAMETGVDQGSAMTPLHREFEASSDPEAFVLELERQAEEASTRCARDNLAHR